MNTAPAIFRKYKCSFLLINFYKPPNLQNSAICYTLILSKQCNTLITGRKTYEFHFTNHTKIIKNIPFYPAWTAGFAGYPCLSNYNCADGSKKLYQNSQNRCGYNVFPVVVLVNGTGVYGSKYKALFEHLASWGFLVLGNEDPSTCSGDSADAVLAYLLEENERADSIFYQKVDRNNIGISGHSQGGIGVFNAVTVNAPFPLNRCKKCTPSWTFQK